METNKEIKIVIVEDDSYYNKALTRYVSSICNEEDYPDVKFNIQSYFSAYNLIEDLEYEAGIDLMLLDYYLLKEGDFDNINGDYVIGVVKNYFPECKIVMVSDQENEELAKEMLEKGVFEYIDKNTSSKDKIESVIKSLIVGECV